jgi:hypothetical protein
VNGIGDPNPVEVKYHPIAPDPIRSHEHAKVSDEPFAILADEAPAGWQCPSVATMDLAPPTILVGYSIQRSNQDSSLQAIHSAVSPVFQFAAVF